MVEITGKGCGGDSINLQCGTVVRVIIYFCLFPSTLCPAGAEQPGRPGSHGYVRSPSPSVRSQENILQQRPSIFQGTNGTSVITPLDPAAQLRIMYVLEITVVGISVLICELIKRCI